MHARTSSFLLCAAALWLAGCQTQPQTQAEAQPKPQVDPPCVVTQAVFANHIAPRHCAAVPPPGANQFVGAYCTLAGAQNFCTMVQNSPGRFRVVQVDGRIRYDANLNPAVVGTVGEMCGRMVMEPNGNVVTQFPELAGAPVPPACQ